MINNSSIKITSRYGTGEHIQKMGQIDKQKRNTNDY